MVKANGATEPTTPTPGRPKEGEEKASEAGGKVTLGTDDKVKASSHRINDVKTGRVTIVRERNKNKEGAVMI